MGPFLSMYTQEQKQSGYSKTVRIYQASEYPEDDIRHPYSYTSKGYIRKISVNQTFEEWENNIKDLLSHPYYRLLFAQRTIEDEPVFGVMKKDKGFIRLHVKGLRKSTTEIGIVLLVQNLQKFFNSTTIDNLNERKIKSCYFFPASS